MINHSLTKKISRILSLVLCIVLFASVSRAQEFDATLHWSQKTELGTVVSGIVDEVNVDVGDKVNKGDKLLQLDTSVFEARVAEYKAKLKSVDEELKEAERERDRALELYERTVLSEHELQVAKNNYITARAKFEKVKAMYAEKKFELKYSVVRAPFDAVVLVRNAQPGQVIATQFKQEPLITVAAANRMLATVLVSEDRLASITRGRKSRITVNSISYTGKVKTVGLELITDNNGKKGYPVNIEFEVKDTILRSGQSAKVNIE